jgi:hypothetical protein
VEPQRLARTDIAQPDYKVYQTEECAEDEAYAAVEDETVEKAPADFLA